jgi:hypothetical protein
VNLVDIFVTIDMYSGTEAEELRSMIDLYYWTTPNGHKITIYLEEIALPYKIIPVNIIKGRGPPGTSVNSRAGRIP